MLTLLRRLSGRRSRLVFRFRAGGRWEYRDPVAVRRRLAELNPRWSDLVDAVVAAAKPLPGSLRLDPVMAEKRLAAANGMAAELADLVAAAFDVPALRPDGSGLTEAERIGVLTAFLAYSADLMDATRPL